MWGKSRGSLMQQSNMDILSFNSNLHKFYVVTNIDVFNSCIYWNFFNEECHHHVMKEGSFRSDGIVQNLPYLHLLYLSLPCRSNIIHILSINTREFHWDPWLNVGWAEGTSRRLNVRVSDYSRLWLVTSIDCSKNLINNMRLRWLEEDWTIWLI